MSESSAATLWGAIEREPSAALRHIKVQGAVSSPGEYPFQENADVLHYLRQAGGASHELNRCKVMIIRSMGDRKNTNVFKLGETGTLPKVMQGDVLIFDGGAEPQPRRSARPTRLEGKPPREKQNIEELPREAHNAVVELHPQPKDKTPIISPSPARERSESYSPERSGLERYIRTSQFKRLLNQVATAQAATGISTIAILSYLPGEGKSFLAAALALGYAKFLDSQVLILDANSSIGSSSPLLQLVAGEYGAFGNQEQNVAPDNALQRQPAFIDVVTEAQLVSHGHSDNDFYVGPYLRSLKSKYDLILVDTVAIAADDRDSIDPLIVAHQVDSSILVSSPASTHKGAVSALSAEIKRSNPRLMGTVFNPWGIR